MSAPLHCPSRARQALIDANTEGFGLIQEPPGPSRECMHLPTATAQMLARLPKQSRLIKAIINKSRSARPAALSSCLGGAAFLSLASLQTATRNTVHVKIERVMCQKLNLLI